MRHAAVARFVCDALRRSKLSAADHARLANIDARTLRRWRRGAVQPQLTEWLRFVGSLSLPDAERTAAVGLLTRPQAVAHLRDRLADEVRMADAGYNAAPASPPLIPFRVAPGDLLRAMRERQAILSGQALTRRAVAEQLRVSPVTVTRWERTESLPPPDRWDAVLMVYGAHPSERQALREGWLLTGPNDEAASSESRELEACEHELWLLADQVDTGGFLLGDLAFRTLERRLGRIALRDGLGDSLLVRSWEWHAEWLQRNGRWRESRPYFESILATPVPRKQGNGSWDRAVIQAAQYAGQGAPRASPKRGLDVLDHWLGSAKAPSQRSALLRDMAQFYAHLRRVDEAKNCISEAISQAERSGDPSAQAGARFILARCLLDTGRPEQALVRINAEADSACAGARVQQEMVRIRALLALHDPEAQARLATLYDLLDRFGYQHLRPDVDALSALV